MYANFCSNCGSNLPNNMARSPIESPQEIAPAEKTTSTLQIVTVQAQRTKIKPKAVFLTLLMTGLICSALFAIFYLADWDWNKVGLEPYLESINFSLKTPKFLNSIDMWSEILFSKISKNLLKIASLTLGVRSVSDFKNIFKRSDLFFFGALVLIQSLTKNVS